MYWKQPSVTTVPGTPVRVYGVVQLSVNVVVGAAGHGVLQPGTVISASSVITGSSESAIVKILEFVQVQPLKVVVSVRVKLPQVLPVRTETFWLVVEPGIVPSPLIDQL